MIRPFTNKFQKKINKLVDTILEKGFMSVVEHKKLITYNSSAPTLYELSKKTPN